MKDLFLVGVGGFIGAVLRYSVSGWVQQWTGSTRFPYGVVLAHYTDADGTRCPLAAATSNTLTPEVVRLWSLFILDESCQDAEMLADLLRHSFHSRFPRIGLDEDFLDLEVVFFREGLTYEIFAFGLRELVASSLTLARQMPLEPSS